MTRPLIQLGEQVREMTIEEYEAHQAEIAAQEEALHALISAKESAKAKLAALGLTEAEVQALLGL